MRSGDIVTILCLPTDTPDLIYMLERVDDLLSLIPQWASYIRANAHQFNRQGAINAARMIRMVANDLEEQRIMAMGLLYSLMHNYKSDMAHKGFEQDALLSVLRVLWPVNVNEAQTTDLYKRIASYCGKITWSRTFAEGAILELYRTTTDTSVNAAILAACQKQSFTVDMHRTMLLVAATKA